MLSVKNARKTAILGEIILLIGGLFHHIGFIIGFIGTILVLLGIKRFSEAAKYPRPFYVYLGAVILSFVIGIFLYFNTDALKHMSLSGLFLIAWILILIEGSIQAFVWNDIKKITGVGLFGLAAALIIIGAILFILLIGAFLILIGYIVLIIALLRVPDYLEPYPYSIIKKDEMKSEKYWKERY